MSERSDLERRAEELSEALGLESSARRMSNVKLAKHVEELEQLALERESKLVEESTKEAHRMALVERLHREADEQRGHGMRYAFEVAPGKQLQCRVGLLHSGCQVKREWVGGFKELEQLVEAGAVLCGPLARRFEVAPDRKLENTTRGTLRAGARVEPEYVGGIKALEKLIREGHVKRNAIEPER
jgi:hypothetical protein